MTLYFEKPEINVQILILELQN